MRYIFLLIIIGASVATFFMVIKPRYDTLQTVKNDVTNYDSSLETAEKLKISREELIAKYNSIPKTDLDGIKTLLPDSVDNIRLIIQLDSLATKNGLSTLRSVDYRSDASGATGSGESTTTTEMQGVSSSGKSYGEFVVSFQTSGQYKNFLAFLSDLEQNLRLVDVTAIDFTAAPTDESSGTQASTNMSYKVTLKTYWLKK